MGKTVKEVLLKAGKQKKHKGGGAKKIGRNLAKCGKYKAEGRREKNKKRIAKKQVKIEAKHKEKKKVKK